MFLPETRDVLIQNTGCLRRSRPYFLSDFELRFVVSFIISGFKASEFLEVSVKKDKIFTSINRKAMRKLFAKL